VLHPVMVLGLRGSGFRLNRLLVRGQEVLQGKLVGCIFVKNPFGTDSARVIFVVRRRNTVGEFLMRKGKGRFFDLADV
jgi:hypothetical protein